MDKNGIISDFRGNLCNLYMCRKNDHFFVQNAKLCFCEKRKWWRNNEGVWSIGVVKIIYPFRENMG